MLFRIVILVFIANLLGACSMNMFYYFPDKNPVQASANATEHSIAFHKEKSVHGLFFPKKNPIASVFILHGNAGNLTGWQSVAEMLWEEGYQPFIIDYPGFGNSDGKPKHATVIEASQKSFEYFCQLKEVDSTKKILMGFSLGGNLALKIGTDYQDKLDALVVEGAFTNYRAIGMARVAKPIRFAPWLVLGNKFKGEELIREWKKPLLVVHSKKDEVVPYAMGKEIYENAGTPQKELWTIDGKHLQGFGLYSEEYFIHLKALLDKGDQ